jgi:mono/diheme cytochrome c family protein
MERGKALYNLNCGGCHGLDAKGIAGLGFNLSTSEYIDPTVLSDAESINFIRAGRPADSPTSKIGRPMPPSGGNPALTDAELLAIIRYIRTLRE